MDERLFVELAKLNGLIIEKCEPGQGGYEMEDGTIYHRPIIDGLLREHFVTKPSVVISTAEVIDNIPSITKTFTAGVGNLSPTQCYAFSNLDIAMSGVTKLSTVITNSIIDNLKAVAGKIEFAFPICKGELFADTAFFSTAYTVDEKKDSKVDHLVDAAA